MTLQLPPGDFDGYIFDCDGTIADTMPLHYLAWQHALGPYAKDFPEDLFYQWGGTKTNRIVELLNELHSRDLNVNEIVHLKETWFVDHLGDAQPIKPAVEILQTLAAEKKLIALASGGFRHVIDKILKTIKLEGIFPVIVTADDVIHGKPDPEPFLKAASLLGAAPSKCLVFEDSPTGIKAAVAAGMQWVEVTREMR